MSSPDVLVLSYLESFLCNSNEIIFSSLIYLSCKTSFYSYKCFRFTPANTQTITLRSIILKYVITYFLATSLSRWPLRLLVSRVRSLLNIHVISSYCRLLPCNAREKISLIGCAGHSECIGQSMRENFSRMMPIGSIHTIAFIQWAVFLTNKSHM